jgi:photosynthetic reaction center cytochrome c subunit
MRVGNSFHLGCFCALLALLCPCTRAQSNINQPSSAEHAFKNIQILKSTPADQLLPAMQFMSSSLGVQCSHCHVEGAFEKDDKKPKQQARQMMQMTFAINQNNFSGKREVTCNSCHLGSLRPTATPLISSEAPKKADPTSQTPPNSVSPEEILNRYLQAIGGQEALGQVKSEVKKGSLELGTGTQFPVEIFQQPQKRSLVVHLSTGTSEEVLNGDSGWSLVPGRALRTMSPSEIRAARIEADPMFLASIKEAKPELKALPDEQLPSGLATVIRLTIPNQPPIRLYLDQRSGLLLRIVRFVDSPLGQNPTQIDYSDYRTVAGTKQPFRWNVAQPQGRFTIQLNQIEVNVPVEASRFAKPDVPPAPAGQ